MEVNQQLEGYEESIQERYDKMLKELIAEGWSPRKARKYLEAISRKQIEKIFRKNNKASKRVIKKSQSMHLKRESETPGV